jgi:hypothetical protein
LQYFLEVPWKTLFDRSKNSMNKKAEKKIDKKLNYLRISIAKNNKLMNKSFQEFNVQQISFIFHDFQLNVFGRCGKVLTFIVLTTVI